MKLEKNNDRDWFQANKKAFDTAQANLVEFSGFLIGEIGQFDDAVVGINPLSCVFRIYRDVRFSKDKSPYKTNLGSYISPGGRKSMQPGYYFHIQPGQSFIAAGKHIPDGPETLKIRNAIAVNPDEFRANPATAWTLKTRRPGRNISPEFSPSYCSESQTSNFGSPGPLVHQSSARLKFPIFPPSDFTH